jgi:hypothetical protein
MSSWRNTGEIASLGHYLTDRWAVADISTR